MQMGRIKVFISQPMHGLSDEYIKTVREFAKEDIEDQFDGNAKVLNTLIEFNSHSPIYNLGKSIEMLSKADYAYFCPGWQDYRGCRIEHQICVDYDIKIMRD